MTSNATLPATMRAITYDDYGDPSVLHVAELKTPQPDSDEVLIEVRASSVNPIDYRLRKGEMKGLLPGGFPRIPGYDVAGIVVQSDSKSTFAVGQRVIAFLDAARGGAAAQYAVCSVDSVCRLPDSVPFKSAAGFPLAGTTALQSLRDHGRMRNEDRVLINGASGGVGMFAVQIAKAHGCHVDAVASGDNEAFCKSIGADHFYDYEKVDFSDSSERWDVIFDAAGKSGYSEAKSVLLEDGRYVTTEPDVKGMLMTVMTWPLSKSGTVMLAKPNAKDLSELLRLHTSGELSMTVDSEYPMSQIAAAHQRIEDGIDHGKVILINDL